MPTFLIFCGVVIIVLWVYILWGREWLEAHLQGTRYIDWHVKVEDKLWSGSRTMLFSLGLKLGGLLIALHEFLVAQGYDETGILTQVQNLLPEKYRPFAPIFFGLFLIILGQAVSWLRKQTTTPIGE